MEEATDPEGRRMLQQASRYAAVGLEMGLAMALGILGGRYADSYFETKPIFFWVGFGLGVGAAAKAIVDATRRLRKELTDNETPSSKKD